MPANITEGPVSLSITQLDMALFSCTASGIPRPSIWWIGPNNNIILSDSNTVQISLHHITNYQLKSVLMLSNVNISRNGTYICSASNGRTGYNAITVKTVDLYVHGMSHVLLVIASIIIMLKIANLSHFISNETYNFVYF